MSDDEAVILATPVDRTMRKPVEGSVTFTAKCGHEVWLAPTSVDLLADPGQKVAVMCMPCVQKKDVQNAELMLLPGQMDELQGKVGSEKRQHLEQILKAWGFKDA